LCQTLSYSPHYVSLAPSLSLSCGTVLLIFPPKRKEELLPLLLADATAKSSSFLPLRIFKRKREKFKLAFFFFWHLKIQIFA
jgi:hypothetical protein